MALAWIKMTNGPDLELSTFPASARCGAEFLALTRSTP